jgi:hypothetical protein
VIDFGVVCHATPERTTTTDRVLDIAQEYYVERSVIADGLTWYRLADFDPCWIDGASTTESSDVQSRWLTLLDYQNRRSSVPFEQYVHLANLVADPRRVGRDELTTSGLVQFELLRLLERAIVGGQGRRESISADPLKLAWMFAHMEVVGYNEFGGVWYVRAAPYWALWDRNRVESWAEELAWVASQHRAPSDECESDCALGHIIQGPQQYWTRYPDGSHIVTALQQASERSRYAAEMACFYRDPTDPQAVASPVSSELVDQIRVSLAKVEAAGKLAILKNLDEAEQRCAN